MKRTVNALVKILKEKKLTVALAESMTAGLASYQITTVKGASDVFMGGVACYHPSVKSCALRVSKRALRIHSPESYEVTKELAKGLSQLVDANLYAAITGLAASGGSETPEKPVGTVFISVLYKGKYSRERLQFKGTPKEIKKKACEALFLKLIETLSK